VINAIPYLFSRIGLALVAEEEKYLLSERFQNDEFPEELLGLNRSFKARNILQKEKGGERERGGTKKSRLLASSAQEGEKNKVAEKKTSNQNKPNSACNSLSCFLILPLRSSLPSGGSCSVSLVASFFSSN
jgi:hypothetical protein